MIFKINDFIIDFHAYKSRKLCILYLIIANILKIIYNKDHNDFTQCYEKILTFYYIRNLI